MNLFGIGTGELLLILVVALLVLGPERLPEYARKGAILLRRLRSITDEVNRQIREELDLDDLTDIVEETRATLSDPLGLKQLTMDASQPAKPKTGGGATTVKRPPEQAPALGNTIAPPGIAALSEPNGAPPPVEARTAGPASDAEKGPSLAAGTPAEAPEEGAAKQAVSAAGQTDSATHSDEVAEEEASDEQ